MNKSWTLKTRNETIECTSFPFAYRTAWNIVRKASETKGVNVASVMSGITLLGPDMGNGKGRKSYSYTSATQMATDTGLLTPDGQINSREFKKKPQQS